MSASIVPKTSTAKDAKKAAKFAKEEFAKHAKEFTRGRFKFLRKP
jgi:hypothetical protein